MPSTRQRPHSQQGGQPGGVSFGIQPARKIFNCIVDDTALVAGVKKTTRNGIRQWVKNAQIRLFVPLHALEQLSRQKNGTSRHSEDVRETLQWLDDATTRYPHAVTLQGGDQYYQSWIEVEQYAVPRTLFSEHDHDEHDDLDVAPHQETEQITPALTVDAIQKLNINDLDSETGIPSRPTSIGSQIASRSSTRSVCAAASPQSPPTSPSKELSSPFQPARQSRSSAKTVQSGVPLHLQSLFNYIIWRVHQELDPVAALETFIFLCNDPAKVNHARGFDIRCKRLEQLRDAVGREDRDFRNRQMVQSREMKESTNGPNPTKDENEKIEDEDEEVVFRPPPRAPAAMLLKQQQPVSVMDPNAFGRGTNTAVSEPPQSPRLPNVIPSSPRNPGPRSPRAGGRANGHIGRGRGNGYITSNGRGRGAIAALTQPNANVNAQNGQIDPDSFARLRGEGHTGRGGRRLWVPT